MPRLLISLQAIGQNAAAVCALCRKHGISVAGVVKGSNGNVPVSRTLLDNGCAQLASDRKSVV